MELSWDCLTVMLSSYYVNIMNIHELFKQFDIVNRQLCPAFMFIKNWQKQTKAVQKSLTTLWNSNLERHYRLGPPLPLPRPRPLPLPRPRPLPATASLFLDFTFGSTSTSSVSRGKLSGRIKYRMLLPRILSVSSCTGSLFFRVIFTALRCVFMLTSTPVIVPWTCVPFFNSMVTVSWLNFIKNLTSFILSVR